MKKHTLPLAHSVVLMIVVALVLAACGGGAPSEDATSAPATDGSAAAPATDAPADTDAEPTVPPEAQGDVAQSVEAGELVPPVVAEPASGDPPFAGQTVTVIVNTAGEKGPISGPLYEVREEFEAATGATLEIVETPFEQHFPKLIQDMATGTGTYDVSIAGAWWLGELVAGDFVLPYDDYFADPRFPQWDYDAVLEGPRSLLEYQGQRYMVANDHDGQVLYYRRDVLEDPEWQEQFQAEYNYALPVPPGTWEEFRDVAAFFNGKDYNRNGTPGSGLTMHLKVGGQGMFHFMSMSAPYVVSPEQNLYWFDPADMTPLVNSPGHVAALTQLVELVQYGPEAMLGWSLGESWDYFLRGNAVLTFTWGDLGALAQQEGSQVKGKIGAGPMPGTNQWYNLQTEAWVDVDTPNVVGNTTGGSWSGVISKFSDAPEASYYLLALMATNEKSAVYAQRGWDGVDPGRMFHFLPPNGSADVAGYEAAGWDTTDAEQYTNAYYEVFGNAVQLPYLRIPGTFEYWTALDVNLSQAATGQITPEEALQATFDEWQSITDRLSREEQLQSYRDSLGLGN
ncbi:MAG: extracellular solute-binding protein [Chloroflexales bacterium]|nr:extracellular solute-binding protein [Chloroflexales bacterium]